MIGTYFKAVGCDGFVRERGFRPMDGSEGEKRLGRL